MTIYSSPLEVAEQCAKICEQHGDALSAFHILHYFHLLPKQQPCVLLTPKDKNEDSTN